MMNYQGKEVVTRMLGRDDVGRMLERIYWIGGAPDGGKTTVAGLLGERYGTEVYRFDRWEMDHIGRADPERQPTLWELGQRLAGMGEEEFLEESWVRRSPAEMARRAIGSWLERMGLVLEDLAGMPADRMIVAEGPGFFPEVVGPLLPDPRRAVWLAPTVEFKRASHARRGKTAFRGKTSDPERAYHNHVERDIIIGEHVAREAVRLGLRVIGVDGSRTAEEIAVEVAGWFRLGGAKEVYALPS